MNTRALPISTSAVLCMLCGCNVDKFEPITIALYPSTQKCTINEQLVDCEQVGTYLRDTMKTDIKREIDVSYTGADAPPKDYPMVDQVANTVRAAGFTNVRAARFDLK